MAGQVWLRMAALAGPALVAACGGNGGGLTSTPAPAPTASPTPPAAEIPAPTATLAPAPSPAPSPVAGVDTPEYRATVGAVSMNALAAYSRGATGSGIGIAIIDSGIDLRSPEFTGRLSAASQDVAGNAGIADEDGHGTAVAFTAAGARNGTGAHGVAYEASVIALRADRPGSCAARAEGDAESRCQFGSDAIARGVDAARTAGARVINLSLGGTAMPAQLQNAIARATAAGIVIVISAGNDGTDNPDAFAAVAGNAAIARRQVIIAGSVGTGDALSTFSDRAGTGAAQFLTAVGERVRAPDETGTVFLWSGTSFAAPQISGAVALLAQAFPNLSGAQIVELLFRTARDVGAAGIDPIYGNGVLDLTRAFQPVGATSVAGSGAAVSLLANATLSAPMGDARTGSLGAVILDSYDRAFGIDLAATIGHARSQPVLTGALALGGRHVGATVGGTSVSVTLAPRIGGMAVEPTRLTMAEGRGARALAGMVTQRVGARLSFGFAFAQGSGALTAQLAGRREPAFLIGDTRALGFAGMAQGAGAIRQRFGALGVTAGIEDGRLRRFAADTAARDPRFTRMTLALDRRIGALALALGGERLAERDTVLGARFGAGLGAAQAVSWFAGLEGRLDAGDGWSLGGQWRHGWTQASVRAGLSGEGRIRTDAFSADIGKDGVWGGDTLGLRIAQPLRVATGGIDIALPTLWDYDARRVGAWTTQRLNLAPDGREIDVEARYARALGIGAVQANVFWRRDPGNIAALPDDYGLAMRYSLGF